MDFGSAVREERWTGFVRLPCDNLVEPEPICSQIIIRGGALIPEREVRASRPQCAHSTSSPWREVAWVSVDSGVHYGRAPFSLLRRGAIIMGFYRQLIVAIQSREREDGAKILAWRSFLQANH